MRLLILFVLSVYSVFAQGSRALILADTDAPNTPTDSPGGGTYGSTQSVTLSDATATIILYTINGSTPACPATGTLYTGAISVAVTTTIKAIGCNGVTGGGVLTSVYTITAGISFVQGTTSTVANVSSSVTTAKATTAGNTLAVGGVVYTSCATQVTAGSFNGTISDTATDTFTLISSLTDAGGNGTCNLLWYAKNITGNAANVITIAWAGGGGFSVANAVEFAGPSTSTPLDATANGTGSAVANNIAVSSFNTASATEVVACLAIFDGNVTITPSTGYTLPAATVTGAGTISSGITYDIYSSTQTGITPGFTTSAGGNSITAICQGFK